MCSADVTAISLVTNKTRDAVCKTVIPYVARALSNQCVPYQRMPLTRDDIDWVINESDQLTVALDAIDDTCIILVATRGEDSEICAARLARIGAELCRDYEAHTVFWNGSETPISAEEFLSAGVISEVNDLTEARVKPRRVIRQVAQGRATRKPNEAQLDQWLLKAVRTQLRSVDPTEIEQMELDERRAKTVPLRLAAWAMSISTALIAAPLAIPLLVHNLVRGEDVRSGALALGVAGLYATLAQTGMVPGLSALL
jgi:hypothetical protein